MESIFLKLAQYPIVETERLVLRPVTLDDAEAMFEYASDRENTRYTFPTNQSLEETKNNIAQFYLASPLGRWGIELKSNGQFIGTIDLHKIDPILKKAAIGYIINQKYWNQGLTTEANRAVIELAFEKIGMNKLTALFTTRTIPHQERSWRNQVCAFPTKNPMPEWIIKNQVELSQEFIMS